VTVFLATVWPYAIAVIAATADRRWRLLLLTGRAACRPEKGPSMHRVVRLIGLSLFVGLLASGPAVARSDKSSDKAAECRKPENVQRSECARALGETREKAQSNRDGATRAGERAERVKSFGKKADQKD
jgi:hypothetical protein